MAAASLRIWATTVALSAAESALRSSSPLGWANGVDVVTDEPVYTGIVP